MDNTGIERRDNAFVVYRSSAGSGKTFTLVRDYLSIVIQDPSQFSRILAITFTNKASEEMKSRILKYLLQLTDDENKKPDVLDSLIEATSMPEEKIRESAQVVLDKVMHQYGDFAVSTIDSFIHRIIRAFTYELNLSFSFNVELDTPAIVLEAVNRVMDAVGEDDELTNLLVSFARSRLEEERSWRVENELLQFGKLLLLEDSSSFADKLKEYQLKDFLRIHKSNREELKVFEDKVLSLTSEIDNHIKSTNAGAESFYRKASSGAIYNFFHDFDTAKIPKLAAPSTYLTDVFSGSKPLAHKDADDSVKLELDQIFDRILPLYHQLTDIVEEGLSTYLIKKSLDRTLYRMAVMNEIYRRIDEIKYEGDILPINEFNSIISRIVTQEPVPFIYEKSGERYNHFLFDEFQDTSKLQWTNLIPLVEESLSKGGKSLIVGDGKQAIYRWRNGDVTQFVNLPKIDIPDYADPKVMQERAAALNRFYRPEVLKSNYRSSKEVVEFNNQFFNWLKDKKGDLIGELYQDVEQIPVSKSKGYVEVQLLDENTYKNKEDAYPEHLSYCLQKVKECMEDGYDASDICVLVRKNDQAREIASFLIESDIEVASKVSMMLAHAPEVRFLQAMCSVLVNRQNTSALATILEYLRYDQKIQPDQFHRYLSLIKPGSENGSEELGRLLNEIYNCGDLDNYLFLPIYDMIIKMTEDFGVGERNALFVRKFCDISHEYVNQNRGSLFEYNRFLDETLHKTSVSIPDDTDAVRVFTIHSAKGLEFPVVIYPFAREEARIDNETVAWANTEGTPFEDILPVIQLPVQKYLENTIFEHVLENERRNVLQDTANLVYVAMTRAMNRLYISTSKSGKGGEQLYVWLKAFCSNVDLPVDESGNFYAGVREKAEKKKGAERMPEIEKVRKKLEKTEILFKPYREKAYNSQMERGLMLHEALSAIVKMDDVADIATMLSSFGITDEKLSGDLQILLTNPQLKPYFVLSENDIVRVEAEIIDETGRLYRPDRVVEKDDHIMVIDYKTGEESTKHHKQLKRYAELISGLSSKTIRMMLVYIDKMKVEEVK